VDLVILIQILLNTFATFNKIWLKELNPRIFKDK